MRRLVVYGEGYRKCRSCSAHHASARKSYTSAGAYVSACFAALVCAIHSNPTTTLVFSVVSTHHLYFCALTKFASPFVWRLVFIIYCCCVSLPPHSALYHQDYSRSQNTTSTGLQILLLEVGVYGRFVQRGHKERPDFKNIQKNSVSSSTRRFRSTHLAESPCWADII